MLLEVREAKGVGTHKLTIELDNRTRRIVQARGRFNALPDDATLHVVRLWANSTGLAF